MSKPSSSTTPEFATQYDYSDILSTATPPPVPSDVEAVKSSAPAHPPATVTHSGSFKDPWSEISRELEVPLGLGRSVGERRAYPKISTSS